MTYTLPVGTKIIPVCQELGDDSIYLGSGRFLTKPVIVSYHGSPIPSNLITYIWQASGPNFEKLTFFKFAKSIVETTKFDGVPISNRTVIGFLYSSDQIEG